MATDKLEVNKTFFIAGMFLLAVLSIYQLVFMPIGDLPFLIFEMAFVFSLVLSITLSD